LSNIDFEEATDFQKLDDIDTPFPALVFGDKGLRTAKFFGQLRLGETCGLSRCNKALAEHLVNG
jgi:hypothetical protein